MRVLAPLLPLALLPLVACEPEGCLTDAAECTVPSPCQGLAFTCDAGSSEVFQITSPDQVPGGTAALGAVGDWVLANDQIVAVIDDLEHPHYIARSGGGLLDLSLRGQDNDSFRHLFQATGLLPDEASHYTEVRVIEEGDVKALQFRGTTDGHPGVHITTRYEIRPCEPGIRVRTELINLEPDPQSIWLADAHYYGDRELTPFAPGVGYVHPPVGLTTLTEAFHPVPYMVAANRVPPAVSYATVSCDQPTLTGFNTVFISALGAEPRIVASRDSIVFERFIGATEGSAVSPGADLALELRRQLWDEPYTELSGQVVVDGDQEFVGRGLRGAVLISEDKPGVFGGETFPWTHALPDDSGAFTVRVPVGRTYRVEVEAFGRTVAESTVEVGAEPVDMGAIEIPAVGELTLSATVDGEEDHVLALIYPADDATAEAVEGQMYGLFEHCAPLLGNVHGESPGCNRILLDGEETVAVPPGRYDIFAVVGPFSTLAAARGVTVDPGTGQSILLELERLPLQPEGSLSADFHVHGAASFDSMQGHTDRMRAFLASGLQVIASTDHDVVWDYAEAREALNADERLHLLVGVEATGHVLFKWHPGTTNPKVVGHWNFWPVPFDPAGPYRGAAWDELAEPGLLMTRMQEAGWDRERGVVQLNHPWGGSQFARDYAWGGAAEVDLTQAMPEPGGPDAGVDGTPNAVFTRTPEGAAFSNHDYNVQEVMNGSANAIFQQYRAVWHWVLNEGLLRGGTANSDSHNLIENVIGLPQTLVFADTTFDAFDAPTFNAAVRDGRMLGTNGPVIELSADDAAGGARGPSLTPFAPGANLRIRVSAAPWVPVEEVRVVVNGEVVRTLGDLPQPADPFSASEDDFERLDVEISLAELLPASGDAWLVVEAGHPLVENADLDCNGIPDTGDNNGDGVIDWRDVEDLAEGEDPGLDCLDSVGPFTEPALPTDRNDPLYLFSRVVPHGTPSAFTNPLVFDRDGNGYQGAGQ